MHASLVCSILIQVLLKLFAPLAIIGPYFNSPCP